MLISSLLSITLSAIAVKDTVDFKDSLQQDIVILAARATGQTPVSQSNFSKKQIEKLYFGADLPYILHASPSIISQSDAGNGFGYSYFRLRGIDNTRINFNINGIPINDPENHGFFSNNFADLASSASSIQVQRGVGTTANGTAPIAGSVQIATQDVRDSSFSKFTLGYGSYDSRRITLEHNTGVDPVSKFGVYARVSVLSSDGFRKNSASNMKTFFFGGGYFGKRSTLKFNVFGGSTQSNLAYYAVSKSALELDYRTNFNAPTEKDAFQQFFYQLQYDFKLSNKIQLSAMGYFIQGNAPKFTYSAINNNPDALTYDFFNLPNPDANTSSANFLLNYKLDQATWGSMVYANYKSKNLTAMVGVHANSFTANHYQEVVAADVFPSGYVPGHQVYFNTGKKRELSSFFKLNYFLANRIYLFADMQLRYTDFAYSYTKQPIFVYEYGVENLQWLFFNPKAGAKVAITDKISAYTSFGITSREPARLDMFQGSDYASFQITKSNIPNPETVLDIETGIKYASSKFNFVINGYAMEFKNEIVATGLLNNFGYYLRQNVPQSFRRGVEIETSFNFLQKFTFSNATSFSYNRIKSYSQSFLVKDSVGFNKIYDANENAENKIEAFANVSPVLTPSFATYNSISYRPTNFLTLELAARFVGKMYLDNSNNEQLTTPSFLIADAKIEVKLDKWTKINSYFRVLVNNIFNEKYYTSGTPSHWYNRISTNKDTRFVEPNYFVGALRNVMFTAGIKF